MGKRGPKKQPLELKLLTGSYEAHRDGDLHKQPRPQPVGVVEPPAGLGEVGLQFWHDHFDMLKELGLLTDPDVYLFGKLCFAVESLDQIDADLREQGFTYTNTKGDQSRNPLTFQRRDVAAEVHKLTARFGMTPADRSGMQVDKPKKESKVRFKPLGT